MKRPAVPLTQGRTFGGPEIMRQPAAKNVNDTG
jgi:hypothetical protein